jgi:phosphotransferase system enzyme I (PtsI)
VLFRSRREQIDFCDDLPVGLTIEVPSAAATIDLLARDVEFLSVGTNDLIQYLLAVDRSDPGVASLYQPLHPAVLRTIRRIVEVADAQGIPVSLCGEMASEPLTALALVGLGVRSLSMTPTAIPRVKAAIRAARASVLETVATESLALGSPEEIIAALRTALAGTLATD